MLAREPKKSTITSFEQNGGKTIIITVTLQVSDRKETVLQEYTKKLNCTLFASNKSAYEDVNVSCDGMNSLRQ